MKDGKAGLSREAVPGGGVEGIISQLNGGSGQLSDRSGLTRGGMTRAVDPRHPKADPRRGDPRTTDQNRRLDQLRHEKWHLNGAAVRTLDDARRFIESVGFCLMYPMRKPLLAPTFIGAWTGSDKNLPTQQHAYADARAREATEVMVRLLRNHDAYEANQFEENNAFLVAGSIFPYFYALVENATPNKPLSPNRVRNILRWRVTPSN